MRRENRKNKRRNKRDVKYQKGYTVRQMETQTYKHTVYLQIEKLKKNN